MVNTELHTGDGSEQNNGSEEITQEDIHRMSRIFQMLSDGSRLRVFQSLMNFGERTVLDLCADTHLTQPALSHHLRLMRDADMVAYRAEGRNHLYYIETKQELISALQKFRNLFQDEQDEERDSSQDSAAPKVHVQSVIEKAVEHTEPESVETSIVDSMEDAAEAELPVTPQMSSEDIVEPYTKGNVGPRPKKEKPLHKNPAIMKVCRAVLAEWGEERSEELRELITFLGLIKEGGTLQDMQERLKTKEDTPESIAEELTDMYEHHDFIAEHIFLLIDGLLPSHYRQSWAAKWINENYAEFVASKLQSRTGVLSITQFILKQLNDRWVMTLEIPVPSFK